MQDRPKRFGGPLATPFPTPALPAHTPWGTTTPSPHQLGNQRKIRWDRISCNHNRHKWKEYAIFWGILYECSLSFITSNQLSTYILMLIDCIYMLHRAELVFIRPLFKTWALLSTHGGRPFCSPLSLWRTFLLSGTSRVDVRKNILLPLVKS